MPFPEIYGCLVCEGVRQELLGKYVIVGFYGIAPYVSIAIRDFNQPVGVTFFWQGGAGSGNFRISARLTAPNGTHLSTNSAEGSLMQSNGVNFFLLQFLGVLPGPGRYSVALL